MSSPDVTGGSGALSSTLLSGAEAAPYTQWGASGGSQNLDLQNGSIFLAGAPAFIGADTIDLSAFTAQLPGVLFSMKN